MQHAPCHCRLWCLRTPVRRLACLAPTPSFTCLRLALLPTTSGCPAAGSSSPLLLSVESLLGASTPPAQDRVVLNVTHPRTVADTSKLAYSLEAYAYPSAGGSDTPLATLPLTADTGAGTLAAPLVFTVPAK